MADGERHFGERRRFVIELLERCSGLELECGDENVRTRTLATLPLVAPQDEHVEQAVAESMPPQGLPFIFAVRRKEWPVGQFVQVFADHDRIEQREAIVKHQGWNL